MWMWESWNLGRARLQQLRDQACQACLTPGPDAAPDVTVEVLEEQQVVAEVRVLLKTRILRKHRTLAVVVLEKDSRQPRADLVGDIVDRDMPARTHWTLDLELIAVVVM